MAKEILVSSCVLRTPGQIRFQTLVPYVGIRALSTLTTLSLDSRGSKISKITKKTKNQESDAALSASTPMDTDLIDLLSTPSEVDETVIGPLEEAELLHEVAPQILKDSETIINAPKLREKLSGAARKRYKWLVAHGLSLEEAKSKARQPCPKKRNRSDSCPNDNNAAKKTKTTNIAPLQRYADVASTSRAPHQMQQQTFKQALESFKVGILTKDFPETLLNNSQMTAIQDTIFGLICDTKAGSICPRFHGTNFRPGWLVFNCKDLDTAKWLMSLIPEIKPWEGASLKAVEEEEIPKNLIIVGHFPVGSSFSNERILNAINVQNMNLTVSEWRIIRREAKGNASLLTLSVDHKSAALLKKREYIIDFRFGEVQLRTTKVYKAAAIAPTPTPSTTNSPPAKSDRKAEASTVPTVPASGLQKTTAAPNITSPPPTVIPMVAVTAPIDSVKNASMVLSPPHGTTNSPPSPIPSKVVSAGTSLSSPKDITKYLKVVPPTTTSSKGVLSAQHRDKKSKGKARQKLIKAPSSFTSTPKKQ